MIGKRLLVMASVLLPLAIAGPSQGQYIFLDNNGDGACNDYPSSAPITMDVWLDSTHNADGTPVNCSDGLNPLDVGSFDIIVHNEGGGDVTFTGFDGQPGGFTISHAFTTEGADMSVGYVGASYMAAGLIKLGTIHLTQTGNPAFSFLTSPPSQSFPSSATGFGSHCSGSTNPNFMTLGIDFFDWCGPIITDAVKSTTWGKIKRSYGSR